MHQRKVVRQKKKRNFELGPRDRLFFLLSSTMLDQMANDIKLLSGSSHPELSAQVASRYVEAV